MLYAHRRKSICSPVFVGKSESMCSPTTTRYAAPLHSGAFPPHLTNSCPSMAKFVEAAGGLTSHSSLSRCDAANNAHAGMCEEAGRGNYVRAAFWCWSVLVAVL